MRPPIKRVKVLVMVPFGPVSVILKLVLLRLAMVMGTLERLQMVRLC